MKIRLLVRILSASLATAGMLAVSGCVGSEPFPTNDFGQETMQRHYQNGEMNNYQYQTGSRYFNPKFNTPGAMPPPTPDQPAVPPPSPPPASPSP